MKNYYIFAYQSNQWNSKCFNKLKAIYTLRKELKIYQYFLGKYTDEYVLNSVYFKIIVLSILTKIWSIV